MLPILCLGRQLRSSARTAQHLLPTYAGVRAKHKASKAAKGKQLDEDDCWEDRRRSGQHASTSAHSSASGSNGGNGCHIREDLKRLADMTRPAQWFPCARANKRTIVAHLGPTNSGKTHAALTALKAAGSGVYCGPLRLLACEVADRLNADGVPCNLVTGQEYRPVPGARHTACTVEMAQLDHQLEVAVVDEVQMLADPGRGSSWSHALLGLPVKELHVCGDAGALPLLEHIAAECGDELQVKRYRRLSPLVVMGEALGGVQHLQEGDCVVAFSRRALHRLRREIQGSGRHSACMVYGVLPPDVRRRQAALFNTEGNAYSVLVASDAIGQGLNLSIRRIIFLAMSKYDGTEMRPLKASEVKQIAGRAGRYGISSSDGQVTTMSSSDLPALRAAMATPSTELRAACLMPRFERLALFATAHMSASQANADQHGAVRVKRARSEAPSAAAEAEGAHARRPAAPGAATAGAMASNACAAAEQEHSAQQQRQQRWEHQSWGSCNNRLGTSSTAHAVADCGWSSGCGAHSALQALHTRARLFGEPHRVSAGAHGSCSVTEDGSGDSAASHLHASTSDSSDEDIHVDLSNIGLPSSDWYDTSDTGLLFDTLLHAHDGNSGSSHGTEASSSSSSSRSSGGPFSSSSSQSSSQSSSHHHSSGDSFAAALEAFCAAASLPPTYFLGDASNMVLLARRLGGVTLPLDDLHTFCTSPTDAGSPQQMAALAFFASTYAQAGHLSPDCVLEVMPFAEGALARPPAGDVELRQVEELWHVYSLYVWLGARFGPGVFRGRAVAEERRDRCSLLIELGLQQAAASAGTQPARSSRSARAPALLAAGTAEGPGSGVPQQAHQGAGAGAKGVDISAGLAGAWQAQALQQRQRRAEWRAARKRKGSRRKERWAGDTDEDAGWNEYVAASAW